MGMATTAVVQGDSIAIHEACHTLAQEEAAAQEEMEVPPPTGTSLMAAIPKDEHHPWLSNGRRIMT